MKNTFYWAIDHQSLYNSIFEFFGLFAWFNVENSKLLKNYIAFFFSFNQFGLNTNLAVSQIMLIYWEGELGMDLLKFMLDNIVNKGLFQANLFDLLNSLASTNRSERNKIYIVKWLVKWKEILELMMDTEGAWWKINLLDIYFKKWKTLKDRL